MLVLKEVRKVCSNKIHKNAIIEIDQETFLISQYDTPNKFKILKVTMRI